MTDPAHEDQVEHLITDAVNSLYGLPGEDSEAEHCKADEILCDLLGRLGAEPVAVAFRQASDRVGFWYG